MVRSSTHGMQEHQRGSRGWKWGAPLALSLTLGLGCGDDDGQPDVDAGMDAGEDAAITPDASPDAAVAPTLRFEVPDPGTAPDFDQLPFPCDLFLDGNGRVAVEGLPTGAGANAGVVDVMRTSLTTLDGFGATTAVFFPVRGTVDEASLQGRGHLVSLDASPVVEIPVTLRYNDEFGLIALKPEPGVVLRQGQRYGAWLDTGVTGPGGPLTAPSQATEAITATAEPTDVGAARAWSVLTPLLAHLDAAAVDRSQVLAATVYTVQSITGAMQTARAAVRNMTPPTLSVAAQYSATDATLSDTLGDGAANPGPGIDPGYDAASSIRADHLEWVIHGEYQAPYYLADQENRLGHFSYTTDGTPVVQGTATVRFTLTLPVSADYADTPVVIYQHGITRGREDLLGIANQLAAQGVAVIGIDLPFHGSRRLNAPDSINNITKEAVADNHGDNTGLLGVTALFNLTGDAATGVTPLDPSAVRDNLRQAQLDLILLVHLLDHGDWSPVQALPGLAALTLDADPLVLVAKSFGTVAGVVAAATEPRIAAGFMSVPAAGLIDQTLAHSPIYGAEFLPVVMSSFGADPARVGHGIYPATHHPVVALWQTVLDSMDPLAYAPYVMDDPVARAGVPLHLVLQTCYSDEQVPNQSSEALAGALGLPLVQVAGNNQAARFVTLDSAAAPLTQNLGRGGYDVTGGMVYFTDSTHNLLTDRFEYSFYELGFPTVVDRADAVEIENDVTRTQTLLVDFITSALTTGTPTIVDPYQ